MTASPVRALFVCASLGGGGAERFVATALAHLDRTRVTPHLCLFRGDLDYGLPDDVPLDVLEKRRPWDIPLAMNKLARRIDALRPDVVFSAFAHPNFVTGCALLLCRHRPRWIARVSNDPERGETGAPRAAMRRLYRRAERILANSQGLVAAFAAAYPALRARTHHLPNAVDFAAIDALARAAPAPEDGAPRLVAVGRLVAQKRVDLLLAALAGLRGRDDVQLTLCGDGPLRAALERDAAGRGLGARVHFTGFVANPYARVAHSDIFLLASDYEGLPNAMIEAQGLGVPAVATDCPYGPSEILEPGRTGLLVPVGDAAAIARGVERLLSEPERRRGMGEAARERARTRYAAGPVVRALEDHLLGREAA